MARIVSFIVLVGILVVIAALFFRVMANFLLPMFLAVLLVIIFGPLHQWMQKKCKGRPRVAAGLTTAAIILIFLVPLLLIVVQAAFEGVDIYHNVDRMSIDLSNVPQQAVELGHRIGVHLDAQDLQKAITSTLRDWLTPVALGTTQFLGRLLIGLAIMVISLYYFLADGPGMVRTIMRLSPLDNNYEQQLIDQFANITRAVVVATLLSALAQGLLAGIGFYLVGLQSVFLLMVLSMFLAMVPFVGAAAVWVPASLWLYFYADRPWAAVLLAAYGVLVISMADNLIKPLVLHGRSNLHPLLALLSVLGGVQALGPIGIFVGPMAVVFLHVLLNMLHTELDSMGDGMKLGDKANDASKLGRTT